MTSRSIQSIASGLKVKEPGFYYSRNRSEVSFPEAIHASFINLEDDSFWYQHRNRCIVAVLDLFPPQEPFFDIGGGNGVVSLAIKHACIDVVLVEPTMTGATHAFQRGIKPVICSTLAEAQLQEASLPSAGLFDVLEHVEDDDGFLAKVHKYLIPGGRFYITVPTYNELWSIEDDNSGHYRRYAPRQLVDKMQSLDFEVEYSTCLFQLLPLPIFLMRSIPSRLGLKNINLAQTHRVHRTGQQKSRILNWFLDRELKTLKKKRKISFGSSCLIVARKSP